MSEIKLTSVAHAFEILDAVGDKFFGATFVKNNGEVREMNCRKDVKKHLKGGALAYEPRGRELLPVYDLQAEGYRMVNVKNLLELRISGTRYVRGW